MSFCRRFQSPVLWQCRLFSGRLQPGQRLPEVPPKPEAPECDKFGSMSAKEVLSSEYLPDDDDAHDKLESMKRRRPIQHYDFLLSRLMKVGGPEKMQKAMQVFERMQHEDRYQPGRPHMTMMIDGCAEFGLVDKAFHFYDLLLKRGQKPTKAGVTALLNACAESRDRDKGLDKLAVITDWIRETNYPCNVIQYNAMVKAYAKHGDLKSAFAVTRDMVKEGHELNNQTYCMLLMGCITDRQSGFSHAIRILREMRKHMAITVHAVNLFMRVVRDCGVGEENHMRRLFPQTTNPNVTFLPCAQLQPETYLNAPQLPSSPVDLLAEKFPNESICLNMSSLTIASNRLALVGGCDGVFRLMDESGVKPSIVTVTTLMQCLPACTDMEKQLMRNAESRGVILDTDFFNVMIKKRASRGDYSAARNVLVDLQMRHLSIDVATFGTLAMTCHSRHLGLQLLTDMRDTGFKLNKEIAGALVRNACKSFDFDYLTAVLRAMERHAVRPDPRMLEQMEEAKMTAERILVQRDRGLDIQRRYMILTDRMFDDFKLFHKSWLRRNGVDFVEPEERQFDFQISPGPRTKMYEFEKDMRCRISELRGISFWTPRRLVFDDDDEN